MPKRTYAGPIIDQSLEEGIIYSTDSLSRDASYVLAVDSGSGDLVLVTDGRPGVKYASLYQPMGYVPKRIRYRDVVFTVTDNLSEAEA